MREITFRLSTIPVAKGRPRFHIYRGRILVKTPTKTADYENLIAFKYQEASGGFKFERETPLHVSLFFGMPIPSSSTKSRKAAMEDGILKHTKKPDIDNLIKAVLDALNDIAWKDDSQIIRLSAEKIYSKEPYVYIRISESMN